MRRLWRWVLYRLRLRPTYWTVRLARRPDGLVAATWRVWGRNATAEDIRCARAEAWRFACGRLGGRRNVAVVDEGRG